MNSPQLTEKAASTVSFIPSKVLIRPASMPNRSMARLISMAASVLMAAC
jgi:hypothetical protein